MRNRLIKSWKGALLQLALLSGLILALVTGQGTPAVAGGDCPMENECTFKKPNFMLVLDYSSSMNEEFGNNQTRWETTVDAVKSLVTTDNGFFEKNMHIAIMRFGHDPDPFNPGTPIIGDNSGLEDGQAVDVDWYDRDGNDPTYFDCNGAAIINAIEAVPSPLCQNPGCSGIGTWTKGALDRARDMIAESRADHPEDVSPGDERYYGLLVMTDGNWTDAVGFPQLAPPQQNPAITAQDLHDEDDVPVYVVAVADAGGLMFADELAAAGGTGSAIKAENPNAMINAIKMVVQEIKDEVIVPTCTEGLPRIMIILDGSSSMLNVGMAAGMMGDTGWDKARAALASGNDSLFDTEVPDLERPVEDLVHLGLTVFGSPGEEDVLVQYGPCMQDNFAWALNPPTSCEMPGCDDPWGGPPITWTFKDGSQVAPFFDQSTMSHMPSCQPFGQLCSGSGTFTHLGIGDGLDQLQRLQGQPAAALPGGRGHPVRQHPDSPTASTAATRPISRYRAR